MIEQSEEEVIASRVWLISSRVNSTKDCVTYWDSVGSGRSGSKGLLVGE